LPLRLKGEGDEQRIELKKEWIMNINAHTVELKETDLVVRGLLQGTCNWSGKSGESIEILCGNELASRAVFGIPQLLNFLRFHFRQRDEQTNGSTVSAGLKDGDLVIRSLIAEAACDWSQKSGEAVEVLSGQRVIDRAIIGTSQLMNFLRFHFRQRDGQAKGLTGADSDRWTRGECVTDRCGESVTDRCGESVTDR
jgi:hypothetical protein